MRILTASGQQPDRIAPESIISGSFSTLRQCTGVSAMLTADRLPAGQICEGSAGSGLDSLTGEHFAGLQSSCSGGSNGMPELFQIEFEGSQHRRFDIITRSESLGSGGFIRSRAEHMKMLSMEHTSIYRNQLNESSGDWRSIELVPIHQLGCSMVLPSCMGQPQGGVEWKSDEAIYPRVPDHYHPCVLLDLAIWTSAQLRQVYLS
ncbi:hypothetical protein PGT21_016859 [Puccinia graminis f. sp. tritici]|uniref:Uncharacterized protein n=1 Tax=Puccinia graminis f. sp. tritici TaxID=56615 RepID=A0A5B0MT61_PUCGR|nr:hypothetical protein PGT21_016859 [Puccinia graminis f. sp. tritici]